MPSSSRPDDIMDEPADFEEHDEPNPIQETGGNSGFGDLGFQGVGGRVGGGGLN